MRSLRDKLEAIQDTLVAYYSANVVSFSGGDPFNLLADDSAEILAQLGRRVYKTRNAVVHSKEGGKPRYRPFRHDQELARELPLMRLLAEEIVINSALVPS